MLGLGLSLLWVGCGGMLLDGVEQRRSACLAGNNVTSRDLLALSSVSPYEVTSTLPLLLRYLYYSATLLLSYCNMLLCTLYSAIIYSISNYSSILS